MDDCPSDKAAIKRRPFGSLGGWVLATFFSIGYLLMFLDMFCISRAHDAKPVSAIIGGIGLLMGGVSPLAAYVSFQLMGRRFTEYLAFPLAVVVYILCQFLGIFLLM